MRDREPIGLIRLVFTQVEPSGVPGGPLLEEVLAPLTSLFENDYRLRELERLRAAAEADRHTLLARLGRKYTTQALRRMGPERRYPILLSFLKQTLIELTDESIDIFDVCIASRHKKAQKALQGVCSGYMFM